MSTTTLSKPARARGKSASAYTLPPKADPCRDLRPANDNPEPVTHFVERTAMWLVPVFAFALFALVVISAN